MCPGFIEALQELTCLTFLDLVSSILAWPTSKCGDEWYRRMSSALAQLQSLESLIIHQGCEAFPKCIMATVPCLTSLRLELWCDDDADIVDSLTLMLQSPPSLPSLDLWAPKTVYANKLGGVAATALHSCLAWDYHLHVPVNTFRGPKLTEVLVQVLPPTLTSLDLAAHPLMCQCR